MELVLALDQGSSSSRALAIDARGRVVLRAQRPVKLYYPRPGWAEHDPEELARSIEASLDELLKKLPRKAGIVALGLACQRSTVVFWDRETGAPAARAPSWQDGRADAVVAPLQGEQARAHEITGLYLTPYYSAPKIRWFIDNEPGLKKLLDAGRLLVGPVSSFLLWRLTKGALFAADPSMAQRMMLLNLRTLDWDDGMLALFGLTRAILPSIRPTAGDWGALERGGRRIRILSCIGDQQSAAIGLGAMAPGSSVANYGTGAFFLHNTGTTQHRIPGLLTSVGWKLGDAPAVFLQEGTVHAAAGSFDWLRGNLGLFKDNAEIDRLCKRSRSRVFALQAIGGLGAPRWDYTTKTAFFGMSSQTRSEDLVRGVAEGIAFLISDIVLAMKKAGVEPSSARVSGGLSRISYLMQFQADVLGIALSRCAEPEATALGAASLAAGAAGADWAGRLRAAAPDRVFRPKMPPEDAARLVADWTSFVDAQVALSRKVNT